MHEYAVCILASSPTWLLLLPLLTKWLSSRPGQAHGGSPTEATCFTQVHCCTRGPQRQSLVYSLKGILLKRCSFSRTNSRTFSPTGCLRAEGQRQFLGHCAVTSFKLFHITTLSMRTYIFQQVLITGGLWSFVVDFRAACTRTVQKSLCATETKCVTVRFRNSA